jgi:DNA (cytosine-5)-methyltransferase 1
MNELALFAGASGGILGGKLLGWKTVCAVEWGKYPASVLCARQNQGFLSPFPIWDDVQTFDGKPWKGIVNVVSGGFPCQDISAAGKGKGISGERSGMWKHMARIIAEVLPTWVFIENSPLLRTRGLNIVLADLAKIGYNARWGVVSARDVGANHKRDRMWIVGKLANTEELLCDGSNNNGEICLGQKKKSEFRDCSWSKDVSNPNLPQCKRGGISLGVQEEHTIPSNSCWWEIEPSVGRVADGVAFRLDRLKAIGNGQVPLCAAIAFNLLSKDL